MIYFNCDYLEGAHPKIIDSLVRTNMEQAVGYSEDDYCKKAKSLIKKACGREDIDIHFFVGGTQVNMTFISSCLRSYQGVISPTTGHINVHESGAIEATGHKVLPIKTTSSGKILPEDIKAYYQSHITDPAYEHIVQPKMVYISNSTENGAVYTKSELAAISAACKECGLILYLDGARLGYALCSPKSDLTLNDICEYCDAFYIGGTKVGALFGEALVITNPALKEDFRYIIKQRGALLAKGRLLGLQFAELFTDNLYFEISQSAIDNAMRINDTLLELGVEFVCESESNQIFPILSNDIIAEINKDFATETWTKIDENTTVVRFCTSWATTTENVNLLIERLRTLLAG